MAKIHLISGPRNISTAMMYAFDNRDDCTGIDEPFYGAFLSEHVELDHPGKDEVLASQSLNREEIWSDILGRSNGIHWFIKNMAQHIVPEDLPFLASCKSIFLIRDPAKVIHSFSKVKASFDAWEIGIIQQEKLYQHLATLGHKPCVINSDRFLEDPQNQAEKLCEQLLIPFDKKMMAWNAGPREIDGVWAPHWYSNVHKSTCFSAPTAERPELSGKHLDTYKEVQASYLFLDQFAIR